MATNRSMASYERANVMGSQGSTVDSTNYAFLLVAVNHSPSDPYQGLSMGQPAVGFNNMSISWTELPNCAPSNST